MSENEVLAHLTNGSTSVVIVADGGVPEIVHWGAPLGPGRLNVGLFERPIVDGGLDVDPPVGLVTESVRGWFGRPGLECHRADGADSAPRFLLQSVEADHRRLDAVLVDPVAELELRTEIGLDDTGVMMVTATVTNVGERPLELDALRLTLPVGEPAGEVLTLGGRHTMEFLPRRTTWDRSCVVVENRHGKTSHERLGAVFVGTPGFGEHSGQVWGCHLGWSGNYELICDAVSDGHKVVQAGELLLSGELTLGPGQAYRTPVLYGAWSDSGLGPVSDAFHRYLRSRPTHPRLPRPVHLNTWEAVYFDHNLDTLRALADAAAKVGVERFVLDDGWFGGRRDDQRGLGDWWVSPDVWPDGLEPIINHVRGLGMEFGIWVEPEMINPDSDLYRLHPEWALVDHRYSQVLGRNQLVLDLGRPDVRDHLFERLDALLGGYDIAYFKWDHNRDLTSPASNGRAGAHFATLGVYELLDRVRAAHPGVEIESCASGGGRVDFGILARTDRVWTSDSIDALDRHMIQSGFSLMFPPELMGSHIGAPITHATRRSHRLGFRAASALFGAFGIEWNLLEADGDDLDRLGELVALHKRFRPLLHTGRVWRAGHDDPTLDVHGVIARDGSEALVSITKLASGPSHHSGPVRIPGLGHHDEFVLSPVTEVGEPLGPARRQPSWISDGLSATGRQLEVAGFRAPQMFPESSLLVHVHRVGVE